MKDSGENGRRCVVCNDCLTQDLAGEWTHVSFSDSDHEPVLIEDIEGTDRG